MIKLIILLLGFFLASCSTIPFEESKVEVLQLNQAIEGKDIYNKDFIDFLEDCIDSLEDSSHCLTDSIDYLGDSTDFL